MKLYSIIGVFLILISCSDQNKNTPAFTPIFKESTETTHKIPEGQDFTFGYLEVLENRNNPTGNTLKLPVYIFKSRNPNPQKDPIIYTVGGPGSTTMPSAQYMNYYAYLDDRDFILVEQRGTQFAQPSLNCPAWAEAIYLSNLPGFEETKRARLFEDAASACKNELIKNGIDLNQYNTNDIAADIEDLRNVLNIETYNLLTISYSTKIAQVLLRDYPEPIRSVVMDSPLPLEVNYDEESVANLLNVVNTLLSDCESDVACNTAFPNLKNRFFEYLKEKTENPLIVEVKNPTNGIVETFYLKGEDLLTVFTTTRIENIPLEIEKLLNNDLSSIKKQLSYLFKKPDTFNGYGLGMRLSVWCAEEYPFTSQERINIETNKYPETKGLSPAVFESGVCNIWGVKKVNDIENKPIKSDKPILLISGAYDNETPVKWASSMKDNLPNSYHLIFKGWTHTLTTNWSNQCVMQAANDFFNTPNQQPNPECLTKIKKAVFKTK
ncbi:MAG: pimeloyl-ACP methyl ester carboxylesterase [Dokdonia sp.]|jgi:pimeloyl-ACP methyl ester carboxylesterase